MMRRPRIRGPVQAPALSKPETVLVLHGLMMRSPALWPLARRLRRRGYATLTFDYGTIFGTPARAMERLAMLLYAHAPGPVHVVAHSLGGLIALEAMNQYQRLPPGRVVCLGSPLAGSSSARHLAHRHLGLMSGRSGPLLRGGLQQLPQREIGMIAGARSLGLGRVLGRFDGLNDGTVAVWETRLPGLKEHVVLPVSHTGLLFDFRAAEMAADFLEVGYFRAY
jgi:pimeloyl-ACP methyl ester carboxylesterase